MTQVIVSIVFGFIILIFAWIIGFSQLLTIFKTQNTSGTALPTYILCIGCALLSLSWGFTFYFSRMSDWWQMSKDTGLPLILFQMCVLPIIATYIFELVGSICYIFTKIKHIKLAKKYKVSEIELSRILLSKCKNKKQQYLPCILIVSTMVIVSFGASICLALFTNPAINPGIVSPDEKQMTPIIITFSCLGAASWEAISWPQFIKCIKTKDTTGISLNWAIFMPVSCLVSLVYAAFVATITGTFMLDTLGALIFNGVLVNIGVLVLKIINRSKAKHLGISEIEYTRRMKKTKQKRA